MKNKQNANTCYVFSQVTLDKVLQEWMELESKNNPEKVELLKITAVALPWFLKHLEQNSEIYMFTHADLHTEIEVWKSLQISDFPNQKQRIEETCDELISFFHSDAVIQHKMIIEA